METKPLSMIMGVAVGDALGLPVQFEKRGTFHVTGMQGYGTYHLPPGTWSDDTSLTLALADSLEAGQDRPDLERIAKNFIAWFERGKYTPYGKAFDIGRTTANSIKRLRMGVPPEKAGGTEEHSNGNGSLMRISPLTFFLAGKEDAKERFEIVRSVSSLTHGHECSVAACYIYVEMLNALRTGCGKKAAYRALREEFSQGVSFISEAALAKFHRILREDVRALPESEIRSSGYVVDTIEAAFWSFLTTDNYREALLRAVNLGLDTDTVGAVTGAMAGLEYGLSSIPEEWRNQLAAYDLVERIAVAMPRWD